MDSQLPPQLRSLVHHVKLNETGWWEDAARQLIISGLYESGGRGCPQSLVETLESSLGMAMDANQVADKLSELVAADRAVKLSETEFALTQEEIERFESELDALSDAQAVCRRHFELIYEDVFDEACGETEWAKFATDLLVPVIKHYGAEIYDLVTATGLPGNEPLPLQIIEAYPDTMQEQIRIVATRFFDPSVASIRRYVLGLLYSFFVVEACGLSDTTLQGLKALEGSTPRFILLLDTNFVVSAFGLNEDCANLAARKLLQVVSDVAEAATVQLRVVPQTHREIKHLFERKAAQLHGVAIRGDVAASTGLTDISSIVLAYFREAGRSTKRLSADDFFAPYTDGLTATLRSKGIEVHGDASIDGYAEKQSVVDDICDQSQRDLQRRGDRAKDWDGWQHDMILWHYALDKRPAVADSPTEAVYWVLTQDYGLISFDRYKYPLLGSALPVCVDPTRFTQMLSLWLPRSDAVEEAILTSLRVPFSMERFSASSENVAIAIAAAVSRYKQLPAEVVGAVLSNQAMKERLLQEVDRQEQEEIVTETIHQEYRTFINEKEAELAGVRLELDRSTLLLAEFSERNSEGQRQIDDLQLARTTAEEAALHSQKRIEELEARIAAAHKAYEDTTAEIEVRETQLATLSTRLAEVEATQVADQTRRVRRRFLWLHVILPTVIGMSIAPVVTRLLSFTAYAGAVWPAGGLASTVFLISVGRLVSQIGRAKPELEGWPFFVRFSSLMGILFSFVGAVLAGLIAAVLERLFWSPG